MFLLCPAPSFCRAVARSENPKGGGAHTTGVGIICPAGWDKVNCSACASPVLWTKKKFSLFDFQFHNYSAKHEFCPPQYCQPTRIPKAINTSFLWTKNSFSLFDFQFHNYSAKHKFCSWKLIAKASDAKIGKCR